MQIMVEMELMAVMQIMPQEGPRMLPEEEEVPQGPEEEEELVEQFG